MDIVVTLVVFFSIVQLAVVAINLFDSLKSKEISTLSSEFVSILIPARNEERAISNLLSDLQQLNYNSFEVIVFDDQSTDKTVAIVNNFIKEDSRFKLVESNGLPKGWLGKNYGCYCLSKEAKGSVLLFLDADVRVKSNLIERSLSILRDQKLHLLSIFPTQVMKTAGERATVPIMNYILLTLLPLRLVKDCKSVSLAAANGQFMMFDAKTYQSLEPHREKYNCRVEDIEIAKMYKANVLKVVCMVDDEMIECRMYDGLNEAIMGFSKNVKAFFGNSALLATLFWLITSFGWIVLWIYAGIYLFISYLLIIFLTRILFSITSKQSIFMNILFWIPQMFSLGYIILKATLKKQHKAIIWKGRAV